VTVDIRTCLDHSELRSASSVVTLCRRLVSRILDLKRLVSLVIIIITTTMIDHFVSDVHNHQGSRMRRVRNLFLKDTYVR